MIRQPGPHSSQTASPNVKACPFTPKDIVRTVRISR